MSAMAPNHHILRVRLVMALLTALLAARASIGSDRVPVLVELFTSEGCDSCPPADQVLMRLARERNIAGADVIVMSEHVDYWNHLGWKDPFSSRQFTDRQNEYASALGRDGVYTPQMIIDGRYDVLGGRYVEVTRTLSQASRSPKGMMNVTIRSLGSEADLHVAVSPCSEPTNIYLAVTEDNLFNNVSRGENKGLKLSHAAVVRSLTRVGSAKRNTPFTADSAIKVAAEWKTADLHAVVFAQSTKSKAILSVSEVPFPAN
jgi:hypothetical protein